MRTLLIGDLHFGIKSNSLTWLDFQKAFFKKQIFKTLEEKQINRCVFLGDIYDIRYSVNQQVGIDLKNIFRYMLDTYKDIEFIIVAGNHDYYSPIEEYRKYNMYELLFGYEFLEKHANLKIVTDDPLYTDDGSLFLPWYYTDNPKHIDDLLYAYDFSNDVKAIFCHTDLTCWPGPRIASFKGCPIFSGHIHYIYVDEITHLYNIGAALPLTFDDVNQQRYLYILEDFKIVEKIANNTTPRFIRIYNEDIFSITDNMFDNSYVQLCISTNNMNKARYVEQIKYIKNKYVSSTIRVHIIDDTTNIETLAVNGFNTDIKKYIDSNIPDHLHSKYEMIRDRLNEK